MRLTGLLVVVALVVACARQGADGNAGMDAAAAERGAARGLPQHALRFEPAVIVDRTGFERPMGATTLFIPYGWHTQGGVEWGNQYMCTNGYSFNWSATAPDSSASIAVLPSTGWFMNNYGGGSGSPGCQMAPYSSVRQYLEALAVRWKPGAQVLDYRPRADIQSSFAHLNSTTPVAGGQMRTWAEAGEVLFAYTDGGRDMRGTVAAVVVFNGSHVDYGTGPMESFTAQAYPAYGVTAPNGRLDFGYFEAIRRSMQPNPQWQQLIAGHNQRIGQVALEENRKRSEIMARSNAEIAQIRQDSWNATQQSADRRAREFSETIRGVQSYNDAGAPGGTVELSQNYNHAWRLNDGSYVLTNDANFDPNRDLQVEGRKLEVTQ
jgi:hypothetical protein